MHLVAIGGSDAGISAALRARELDPSVEVSVIVADAYPNFSICGIPYYVSGEVAHWRNLAHRTVADLEATGMQLHLDTVARRIDVEAHKLAVERPDGSEDLMAYDTLVVGTGAVPVRPPIEGLSGPDALGPDDGVHMLHSMGDTFAVMRTLEERAPRNAVIVGAGYIGLEMAEALVDTGPVRDADRAARRGPPDGRPRARCPRPRATGRARCGRAHTYDRATHLPGEGRGQPRSLHDRP